MNIEAYIASGILELYALDQLSPADRREVEGNLRQYPRLKKELEQIESALELYGQAHALTPPPELKEKILRSTSSQMPSTESSPNTKSSIWNWIWALLCLGLVAGLTYLYITNQNHHKQIELLESDLQATRDSCMEKERIYADQMEILQDYQNQVIPMAGQAIAPEAAARVYWNRNEQIAYLDPSGLPALPNDKDYQLWGIVDGQPVSMGVISQRQVELSKSGLQLMSFDFTQSAGAFAITLEPKGGSPSPTLEQMFVLGTVAG